MRVEVMGKGPHGVSPVGVAETPGCRGRGVRSYLLYSGGSFSSIQLHCISGGWRTGRRAAEAGKAELVKSDQEAGEPRSTCSSPATKQNQFASKSLRETVAREQGTGNGTSFHPPRHGCPTIYIQTAIRAF